MGGFRRPFGYAGVEDRAAGRLLGDRSEDQVAVAYAGVITLKVDGTRSELICPQGSSGATQQWCVVDDFGAIQDHGDVAIGQGDIVVLPFTGGFLGVCGGRDAAVDAAHVVRIQFLAKGVGDLDFINAAEVDAAVSVFADVNVE